jgi:hypothetical protein
MENVIRLTINQIATMTMAIVVNTNASTIAKRSIETALIRLILHSRSREGKIGFVHLNVEFFSMNVRCLIALVSIVI